MFGNNSRPRFGQLGMPDAVDSFTSPHTPAAASKPGKPEEQEGQQQQPEATMEGGCLTKLAACAGFEAEVSESEQGISSDTDARMVRSISNLFSSHFSLGKSSSSVSSSTTRKPEVVQVPHLSHSKDDLDYYMDHPHRGKCIIINNREFEQANLSVRSGTEVDGKAIAACFKSLHFDVIMLNDCSLKEIRVVIDKIAKSDFSQDDCIACCVMTHGDKDGILWAKDQKYTLDMLLQPFRGEHCKSLVGKPKLFFIQACQGDKLDRGTTICYGDEFDSSSGVSFHRLANWSDFMIAFSTVPGYFSWRNTTLGSWFCQALVSTLNQYWHTHDLLTMMTITNRRVSYDFESFVPTDPGMDKKKQIPCIWTMLTRRLYFRPKRSTLEPEQKLAQLTIELNENQKKMREILQEKMNLHQLDPQALAQSQSLQAQKAKHLADLNFVQSHLEHQKNELMREMTALKIASVSPAETKVITTVNKATSASNVASSSTSASTSTANASSAANGSTSKSVSTNGTAKK